MPPWNADRRHQRPTKFLQRRRFRLVATGLGLVTVLLQYKLVLASPIVHLPLGLPCMRMSYCFVPQLPI